jgi:hypothetical protein
MKTLLLTVIFASNLMISTSGLASMGNSSGGGGNTLDGLMIEEYATSTPFNVLPDLQAAEETLLAKIENLAPDFSSRLKENVNARTWYVIPKTFNELSADRTGLHFETEQPAYQNEEEIFVSLPLLQKMTSKNRTALFQHEIIMTGISNKDERGHASVRKIMHLMEKPGVTELEFCNNLSKYGFGNYMTKTEKENILSLKKAYQQALEATCSKKEGSDDSIRVISVKVKAMTRDDAPTTSGGRDQAYDLMKTILFDALDSYNEACTKN